MSKNRPNFTKKKAELSERLKITRPTLDRYLGMPGAPEKDPVNGWDIGAVNQFVKKHALSSRTYAGRDPEFSALRRREMLSRCQQNEFDLEVSKGKYILAADVEAETARIVRAFSIVIDALPRKAATSCAGRAPAEIEKILRDHVNEAKKQLHEGEWPQ
jgi:hypothetical protein